MKQRIRNLTFVFTCVAVVALEFGLWVQPAEAAFPCTGEPGEYQVGTAGGGPIAPTPMCEREEVAGPAQAKTRPPTFHESAAAGYSAETNSAIADIFVAIILTEEKQRLEAEMANNPLYQKMKAGYWEYQDGIPGMPKGDGCSATYVNLDGAVTIAGPKNDFRQATIIFWGGHIPSPSWEGMEDVTLSQTGSNQPATVEAHHFSMADGQLGSVAFTVPDAQALVNGIFDQHNFKVSQNGTPWIDITWASGNAAKRRLSACLSPS